MDEKMSPRIHDNREKSRFELDVNGQIVFADYRRQDSVLVILYIEAPPSLRGTGAASRLMEAIAEIARSEGRKIAPLCDYAASWIHSHEEHRDLLR
jgi:predicted GNAT family acetyltransferase